ncbi:MAG: type IV pili twitching motility protein PilT, partial [Terriglobales bacterium]
YIRDCVINAEKTAIVRDAIAAGGSQYGMQTFDQSLLALWRRGLVTYDVALQNASHPDDFKLRAQGVNSGGSEAAQAPATDGEFDRGF